MKKFLLTIFFMIAATTVSLADSSKDKVYIGASLLMSFEDFSYNDFIDNFSKSEGNEKTMSGPRYDFLVGYRLSNKFRIEAQYLIISQNSFETDKSNSNVEYKAQGLFANAIIDFWDMQEHFITPFAGIGIGAGSPNLNISYNGIKDEVDNNGFSWQLQGGVNVKLVTWLIVSVKYTYISMPDAKVGSSSKEEIKAEFKRGVQAIGAGVTILI
ncbi:MAG: porin family protein [Endomicrobium sp.]|nr:porin family protein [Endomicrobium sp.]